MSPTNLQNPTSLPEYLVYSDWLSERGDARGELIAVQIKLEDLRPPPPPLASRVVRSREPPVKVKGGAAANASKEDLERTQLEGRERSLLSENGKEWLGGMARFEADSDLVIRWRRGFIDGVRFGPPLESYATSDIGFEEVYRAMMTAVPRIDFMREVIIGGQSADDWPAQWQNMIDVIAELGLPPAVTFLVFDCGGYWDISSTQLGDLSTAYPTLRESSLRQLKVHMGAMSFGPKIDLPLLESFVIETGGLNIENITSIANSTLPNLHTLSLCIGMPGEYGCNVELEHLKPIFEGENLGAVRHLGLRNANYSDNLPDALLSSNILKQLVTLDLSLGTFSNHGAKVLLDNVDAFKHLASINLAHHYVAPDMRTALTETFEKSGTKLDFSDPQEDEDFDEDEDGNEVPYRYVSIAE